MAARIAERPNYRPEVGRHRHPLCSLVLAPQGISPPLRIITALVCLTMRLHNSELEARRRTRVSSLRSAKSMSQGPYLSVLPTGKSSDTRDVSPPRTSTSLLAFTVSPF